MPTPYPTVPSLPGVETVMADHQKATHGPWPAWCYGCLAPSRDADYARLALSAYHSPAYIKAMADVVEAARRVEISGFQELREAFRRLDALAKEREG